MLPEPDVFNRQIVALDIRGGQLLVGGKFLELDLIEPVGAARELNRPLDKRTLRRDFVGTDAEALQESRVRHESAEVSERQRRRGDQKISDAGPPDLEQEDRRADQ